MRPPCGTTFCRWKRGGGEGTLLKISEQGTGRNGSGRCLCGLGAPWLGHGRGRQEPVAGLGVSTLPGLTAGAHLDHLGTTLHGCPSCEGPAKRVRWQGGQRELRCSLLLPQHLPCRPSGGAVSLPGATVKYLNNFYIDYILK